MSNLPMDTGAAVPPKKKSFLIWLIPLILVVLGSPLLCCGGCIYLGLKTIAAPRDAAVAALNNDVRITAKLGTPIKAGNAISMTDFQSTNGNGSATLDFNASGPNGSAQVSGQMNQTAGTWTAANLTVTFPDGTSLKVPQ